MNDTASERAFDAAVKITAAVFAGKATSFSAELAEMCGEFFNALYEKIKISAADAMPKS